LSKLGCRHNCRQLPEKAILRTLLDVVLQFQQKLGADERPRTAFLLITSALLAICVRPNGFLAELRPYPLNTSTEATLNGLLLVAPTHRCRNRRIATPLFFRHAPLRVVESHPGPVRCGTCALAFCSCAWMSAFPCHSPNEPSEGSLRSYQF
jgi:hypothetical protein